MVWMLLSLPLQYQAMFAAPYCMVVNLPHGLQQTIWFPLT